MKLIISLLFIISFSFSTYAETKKISYKAVFDYSEKKGRSPSSDFSSEDVISKVIKITSFNTSVNSRVERYYGIGEKASYQIVGCYGFSRNKASLSMNQDFNMSSLKGNLIELDVDQEDRAFKTVFESEEDCLQAVKLLKKANNLNKVRIIIRDKGFTLEAI